MRYAVFQTLRVLGEGTFKAPAPSGSLGPPDKLPCVPLAALDNESAMFQKEVETKAVLLAAGDKVEQLAKAVPVD